MSAEPRVRALKDSQPVRGRSVAAVVHEEIADLVHPIEEIDGIDSRRQSSRARNAEHMRDTGVHLGVVGQMRTIRNTGSPIRGGITLRQRFIGAQSRSQ